MYPPLKLSGMAIVATALAITLGAAQPASAQHPKITMKQARATALAALPNAKIKSAELETEEGQFIYSFDMKTPQGIKEVWVDAMTGQVVRTENESSADEKKEAAEESTARHQHRQAH
jgi:hypothetical protein